MGGAAPLPALMSGLGGRRWGTQGGQDEEMWGSMGGGGVSEGEEGGASTTTAPNPPPPQVKPNPPQPAPKKRKIFFRVVRQKRRRGDPPAQKAQTPPPPTTTTARPTKAVPAPKPTNPPKTLPQNPPPHDHQDRHPQGCREEGRPSRGSDRRDGRPRTLPQRGREGHRPWYPRAEVRCRLGGIPGRQHPLRGEPLPPLPHPQGGRAAPGRGPGGGPKKDQTPNPHKRNA